MNLYARCAVWMLAVSALLLLPSASAPAQTAQAALQGQITNQTTGGPVVRALVIQRNTQTNSQSYVYSNDQGLYYFPALVPGIYNVRVDALGFQPEERASIELPVASKLELNFALNASGTPAAGPNAGAATSSAKSPNILSVMYGSDAAVPQALMIDLPLQATETVVASLSKLINERDILELPLSGRDVYSLLVLQPGVSSDNATARGLGFSVNGQRVGSSNFLLDGVDNNDLTVTGPATFLSADAVKEYRMTTNAFTAEFGRASGFIANAITRTGTNAFHGTLYEFFNHDRLNANAFSYNWQDIKKPLFRRNQYGASLGGPVLRDRLFFFANLEQDRSSSRSAPQVSYVPSPRLLNEMSPDSPASLLFKSFPVPAGEAMPGYRWSVKVTSAVPEQQRNTLGMGRLDLNSLNGLHHFSARYAVSRKKTENYFFSVYPNSNGPLTVRGENITGNYTHSIWGGANELKFGLSRNSVRALRPHPELPNIYLADDYFGDLSPDTLLLPGMESDIDYASRDSLFHVVENFSRPIGRHALAFGVEWRMGFNDSLHSLDGSGKYYYDDWANFFGDNESDFFGDTTKTIDGEEKPFTPWPAILYLPVNRLTAAFPTQKDFRRFYRQQDWAGFVQDNIKITRRLNVNLGLRYEYFGKPTPRNGTVDSNFFFGPGKTIQEQLASGSMGLGLLKKTDTNNFAPRGGFTFDLTGDGKNVVRGGFGIYYDRVLNNVWLNTRNNNWPLQCLWQTAGWQCYVPKTVYYFDFAIPATSGGLGIPRGGGVTDAIRPSDVKNTSTVALDSSLRTPYSQNWFVGFQREITRNLILEVNQTGALGRKLITADFINRYDSVDRTTENRYGRFNPNYSEITYYATQGHSNHLALETSLIQRLSHGVQFQMSYTYARTKDVQSDPLLVKRSTASQSDVSNKLAVTNLQSSPVFTHQFDPNADWGNSNFDQRHNLVLNFVAQAPRMHSWRSVFGGLQASGLVGVRSGLPFDVFMRPDFEDGGRTVAVRPDFTGKDLKEAFLANRKPLEGGVQLLDTTKFQAPAGDIGTLARNSLYGPGFWNADFALSRTFTLSEGKQLQFRTELFNAFNHTNLGNPNENFRSSRFGQASFGREGVSASTLAAPLTEQPRQVRVALRLYF